MNVNQFFVTVATDAFHPELKPSDGLLIAPTVEPEPGDFVLLAGGTLARYDRQPEVVGTVVAVIPQAVRKVVISSPTALDEMEAAA
ncbi:MAG: hypothetical protein PHT19_10435 [Methylococcus sp.]|nr:hypothetical protein [Methylococcus sp.]